MGVCGLGSYEDLHYIEMVVPQFGERSLVVVLGSLGLYRSIWNCGCRLSPFIPC